MGKNVRETVSGIGNPNTQDTICEKRKNTKHARTYWKTGGKTNPKVFL